MKRDPVSCNVHAPADPDQRMPLDVIEEARRDPEFARRPIFIYTSAPPGSALVRRVAKTGGDTKIFNKLSIPVDALVSEVAGGMIARGSTTELVLSTLPRREFRAGLYEVIKYGVACDGTLFGQVSRDLGPLTKRDVPALTPVIAACCRVKGAVVVAWPHGNTALPPEAFEAALPRDAASIWT